VGGGAPESRVRIARALQGLPPHLPGELERFGFGQRLAAPFDPETNLPIAPRENTDA